MADNLRKMNEGLSVVDINFGESLRQDLVNAKKSLKAFINEIQEAMQTSITQRGFEVKPAEDISVNGKVVGKRYMIPKQDVEEVMASAQASIDRQSYQLSEAPNAVGDPENAPYAKIGRPLTKKAVFSGGEYIDTEVSRDAYLQQNLKFYGSKAELRDTQKMLKGLGVKTLRDFGGKGLSISAAVPNVLAPAELTNGEDVPLVDYLAGLSDESQSAERKRQKDEKEAKENKDNLSDRQERTSFFNKTTLAVTTIVELTRRIFTTVSKIYDNALQTTYAAKAANVDPTALASLKFSVQGLMGKGANVEGAISAIAGGLMNPLTMNESMLSALAPVMGADTGSMVRDMLIGTGDTMGALRAIMESAKAKTLSGGITGTSSRGKAYAEIVNQLNSVAPGLSDIFQAYMKASDYAEAQNRRFNFSDFSNLIQASGVERAAGQALTTDWSKARMEAIMDNFFMRGAYSPEGPYRNFGTPNRKYVNPERLFKDLSEGGVGEDAITTLRGLLQERDLGGDAFKNVENRIKELLKGTNLDTEFSNAMEDYKAMLRQGKDYFNPLNYYLPGFTDRLDYVAPTESSAAGKDLTFNAGSGTMYYETNNVTNNGVEMAATGDTRIVLDVRSNGEPQGEIPIKIGSTSYLNFN